MKNPRTGADDERAPCPRSGRARCPSGTSSPITTWRKVRIRYANRTASTVAIDVVERVRERLLAEGTDAQRGERDAELHRGDEPRRVGGDAQDVARAPVALVLQLDDARAARGDEAVLGRDEEGVQQDENADCDELEEERHAPTPWALVLGGSSSSNESFSIGNPVCRHRRARPGPPGRGARGGRASRQRRSGAASGSAQSPKSASETS